MKWNQLKKRINELIADSVRSRVDFGVTSYRRTHDQEGRGWVTIDKQEVLNMGTIMFDRHFYWECAGDYSKSKQEKVADNLHNKNLFSQWDLHRSLHDYLNLSVNDILESSNPIIKAFGMFDSRVGKRRLRNITVVNDHDLVKRLFDLRCEAEGIPLRKYASDLTTPLENRWEEKRNDNASEEEQRAVQKLAESKRTRTLRALISAVYEGRLSEKQLDTDIAKELYSAFENSCDTDHLYQFLSFIESKTKLMRSVAHVKGIIALAGAHSEWLQPYDTWTSKSHNPDRQFSSLARHLCAKYDVPLFMDVAWLNGERLQQKWFMHIGLGKNIRIAEKLPTSLTKMMAHHFLQAPDTYTVNAAFRWGQVHALEGDSRLCDALLETRLLDDFRDEDFTLSVLRFFIRNPMLDPAQIGPIIDYIWHQRYEQRIIFIERGVAEEVGPEQPNFTMRGRTVDSLLRAVEEWHGRLGRETKGGNLQWEKSDVKDFTFIEGDKKSKNMRVWRITELLSSQELIAEGRQLKHCVSSYAQSCKSGACSIWTMDIETEEGFEKLITIEVHKNDMTVRQARGKRNRRPSEKEKEILNRWASQEGLDIANYV